MSAELKGTLTSEGNLKGSLVIGGSGTCDYEELSNLPSVNGVTLIGDKTTEELGIAIPTKTSDLENDSGFITGDNYYDKSEIDTALSGKADKSDTYTKSQVDTALSGKADKSDTYTKTETDNKIVGLIDDNSTANNKAWSSSKITDEIINILPTGTASGAVASFNTSLALPLVSIDVDNSATKVYQLGGNFFDKNFVDSGKLINASGNEVAYADWNISDFIPVVEGASYYLYGLTNRPNTQQDNFELFDADKTKVGFANVKTYDQPYTIPSGVKYVKFSVKAPDIDTAQFGVSQNQSYCPYSPTLNEFDVGDTITTLIGVNNIFTDSGNVEVVYKKTINDAIAELQALFLS